MCTAISLLSKDHYFGRNLDLEFSYQEAVTVTPRNFPFSFRSGKLLKSHYALIGIATVSEEYPLYYEATNEMGLSMAGLNFPKNAFYPPAEQGKENVAPFELIPLVLGSCADVEEALAILGQVHLAAIPFSQDFTLSPLHWLLCDRERAITLEPMADGLRIYENPVGVLTNEPPFDYHMYHLANYLNLTAQEPKNRFAPKLAIQPYSRGMGAMGLPGDLSSASRFVRAAFTKCNSVCPADEAGAVSQFFHILGSVAQQSGCAQVGDGYERTVYSSCCNTDKGIFYYTTYENSQITGVHLYHEDLQGEALITYPLLRQQQFRMEN